MPKVLITGGTGFVGWWMWKTKPDGFFVNCLSHQAYDEPCRWEWEWDYIVHLAPVPPDKVLNYAGNNVARVLFASSGAVYNEHPTPYGEDKRYWEHECHKSGADCVIARLFTFCGAGLKDNFAVTNFIRDAETSNEIHVRGDGRAVRSYLYGEDLGRWLWAILLRGRAGEAYDVGSDQRVSILDLAREVACNYLPEPDIIIENKITQEPAPFYVPRTADKTRRELGVRQEIGFSEAIRRSIEDYRNER